jgi:hypothetical protein
MLTDSSSDRAASDPWGGQPDSKSVQLAKISAIGGAMGLAIIVLLIWICLLICLGEIA